MESTLLQRTQIKEKKCSGGEIVELPENVEDDQGGEVERKVGWFLSTIGRQVALFTATLL